MEEGKWRGNQLNVEFRKQVQPALASKLEEFKLLGLDSVSENGLWEYLVKKKWRKVKEEMQLHAIVQDILTIKASDYLSYATIETYKTPEFSFEDEDELRELLK